MNSGNASIFCIAVIFVSTVSIGCGDTSLNRSIQRGDKAAVEKYCKTGADLNCHGVEGRTALHTAILVANKEIYELLLQSKADPAKCDADGASVVHRAAEQKDPFWVREALAHGGDANQVNERNRTFRGKTPLFYAARRQCPAAGAELIRAGADVNHPDDAGLRPIAAAVWGGSFELAYMLLDAGADPRLTSILPEAQWDEEGDGYISKRVDDIDDEREKEWYIKLNQRLHDEGYLKKEAESTAPDNQ